MRGSCLRFLLQLSIAAFFTFCAQAQPGCPAVHFQTAVTANLQPSTSSHIDLLRQNDGSYTAYEMANQSPYRNIRTTPNYQKQLTECLPSHAALPPLAAPQGTGNVPGAAAQSSAVARLNSGNYLIVNGATAALFDSELNLISETPLPAGVGFPVLADVNGDGILDIVGISLSGNYQLTQGAVTVEVLLGRPDGSFAKPTSYSVSGDSFESATLAVGDLNGDQKPDVVVASQVFFSDGGKISVFLGNGDGTFQAERVVYSGGNIPYKVAIADLNGDGKGDLAFTETDQSYNNFLAVALGNGDGTFATPTMYPITSTSSLAIGDVNGDGIPDIVTSGVWIFFGDGTGKFPKQVGYLEPDVGEAIILADIDGDGTVDIVQGSGNALLLSSDYQLSVLFGRGGGAYLGPEVSFVGTALQVGETLASGSFRGNGVIDLALLTASGAAVLMGDNAGGFQSTFLYDFFPNTPGALASIANVVVGDFNNDGKLDFAIGYETSAGSGTIAVFLGHGDGTFDQPVNTTVPPGAVALAAGDFNGDGKLDLAVVTRTGIGSSQDAILILLGHGDGTFTAPVSYPAAADVGSVVVGDFNNDGKPDLAVINTFGGGGDASATISFLVGKGDGTFTVGNSIPVPDLDSISVGDFNGDGKLDIAASTSLTTISTTTTTTTSLVILMGHGDGTFTQLATYPVFGSSSVVADLNGDGIPDLVVGQSYLLGNGDGTFQPPVVWIGDIFPNGATDVSFGSLVTDVSFGSLVAADLNGDGKVDLAGITPLGVVSFLNISEPQPAVTVVSSASLVIGPVAPESLATAFGKNLAASTAIAPAGQPFPTTLGNTTVTVQDASGAARPAELLYVSPQQVNFVVPAGTSSGTATVTVTTEKLFTNQVQTAQVQVVPVSPAMFALNANGLAAAFVTLVAGQTQTYESVFTLENGSPVAAPVSLGTANDQAFLTLYGTGLRNASASGVTVDIQGLNAPVSSAGPVSGIDGLDQVTILVPHALAGSVEVSIVVTAAGIAANTVYLTVQ